MHDVLKGKRVVITRPAMLADTLCALIEARGGQPVHLPTIDIRPPGDRNRIVRLLSDLSRYHVGIFVSQNAVRWTIDLLGGNIERLRGLVLVAIGNSTAMHLRQAGINKLVRTAIKADSESLLEITQLQAAEVSGKNVIIFRGTGGRELLANTLRKRGANVDYAEVYQRVMPKYDNAIMHDIWNADKPDTVVITSTEGLQNLFDMLSSEHKQILLDTQLVVIGERIVALAKHLGFNKIPVVADDASDEGILKAILQLVGA